MFIYSDYTLAGMVARNFCPCRSAIRRVYIMQSRELAQQSKPTFIVILFHAGIYNVVFSCDPVVSLFCQWQYLYVILPICDPG